MHPSIKKFKNLRKKHNLKECFALNSNCSEKIIRAHSIQNNRILNRISKDGLLFYFGKGDYDPENMQPKQYGRKEASTFTGFCGYHDQKIFSPIDNFDYKPANLEQEFLFSYRAVAKEYHTKSTILSMFTEILNKEEIPNFNYEACYWYTMGTNRAHDQLSRMRDAFNTNLARKRFFKIYTKIIVFDEAYPLAISSMSSLTSDFQGNKINDLENIKKDWAPIFTTIFPQGSKTYVLIQCLKKEKHIFDRFLEQLNEPLDKLKLKLSMLLLTHCENMAISPIHWDKMSQEQQKIFMDGFVKRSLANSDIWDYEKFKHCNLFYN